MSVMTPNDYPVQFSVDYPERDLNRLTTAFRLIVAIPILILICALSRAGWGWGDAGDGGPADMLIAGGTLLSVPTLLMIVFRQKYPRWWFDFNLQVSRFANRVVAYLALMRDEYPSTDEEQAVHLTLPYPDASRDLNRWLPLVKWFLAIPHYIVLVLLGFASVVAVIIAWFAILFTGRYPRSIFEFVEGVMRWNNRVTAYAVTLVTDEYPPFRLGA
jgi:small-conductance mechanosensitive channel